eukprot:gene8567-392_t
MEDEENLPTADLERAITVHNSRKTTKFEKIQILLLGLSGILGLIFIALSILIWIDVIQLGIVGPPKHIIPSILLSLGILTPIFTTCVFLIIPWIFKKAKPEVAKRIKSKKPKAQPYLHFKDEDEDVLV